MYICDWQLGIPTSFPLLSSTILSSSQHENLSTLCDQVEPAMHMDAYANSSTQGHNGDSDSPENSSGLREWQLQNESLLAELQALRTSYHKLHLDCRAKDQHLSLVQQQNSEILSYNSELLKNIAEVSSERDALFGQLRDLELSSQQREDDLKTKLDELFREKEGISTEVQASSERIKELLNEKTENLRAFSENLEALKSVKQCLTRGIKCLDEDKVINVDQPDEELSKELKEDQELRMFLVELNAVFKLASVMESRLGEYKETREKEKRELESSVVSLREENRDINSMLRIALVEKEAVEKSLNKLKGNNEQKRGAILQIAERGLQKVGFGFMMGTGANEPSADNECVNTQTKSDLSEGEDEVVSLASTMERIMKNLRIEITQLRRSLEESRSDTERLQSLTEKQDRKLAENTLYIKELEDREKMLSQNVEELSMEIKKSEEEIARWREACELEVEAGKHVIEERDHLAAILKVELEKTKAALDLSNGKLKLKEELAAAAIAAQEAAEKSLELADSRAAELHKQIEELSKQLEQAEKGDQIKRRRMRNICWPWQALKFNFAYSTKSQARSRREKLPEMQALLA